MSQLPPGPEWRLSSTRSTAPSIHFGSLQVRSRHRKSTGPWANPLSKQCLATQPRLHWWSQLGHAMSDSVHAELTLAMFLSSPPPCNSSLSHAVDLHVTFVFGCVSFLVDQLACEPSLSSHNGWLLRLLLPFLATSLGGSVALGVLPSRPLRLRRGRLLLASQVCLWTRTLSRALRRRISRPRRERTMCVQCLSMINAVAA